MYFPAHSRFLLFDYLHIIIFIIFNFLILKAKKLLTLVYFLTNKQSQFHSFTVTVSQQNSQQLIEIKPVKSQNKQPAVDRNQTSQKSKQTAQQLSS